MTSNNDRPITMKEGFLVFNFHPLFRQYYRLKHLAIFTKVGKSVIREEWFRS